MSVEFSVEVFRLMLGTALVMVLPVLGTAVVVGLIVSLIQAVTSIQEQTLSFVPKLIAVVFVIMFIAFWMVERIVTFTEEIFNRIPAMAG